MKYDPTTKLPIPGTEFASRRHRYVCGGCDYSWTLTPEQVMSIMRMTPVCPQCGDLDVSEVF